MNRILEIRSYNLKSGTRAEFHQLVVKYSIPMLHRWQVDVVAYGPSFHDEDSYYLMRSYADLTDRRESQNAFYSSDEWRQRPREAILALIDASTSVVIEINEETLKGLRS